jgi:hypothetical protein
MQINWPNARQRFARPRASRLAVRPFDRYRKHPTAPNSQAERPDINPRMRMTAKKTAKTAPVTETEDVVQAPAKAAKTTKPRATKAKAAEAVVEAEAVEGEEKPKAKRGRKPKAESAKTTSKAAAKTGKTAEREKFDEEDFSDIEADLEGEVEETAEAVEAEGSEGVDTSEDKPKAKPLRMKVSRAKERALMREFGLGLVLAGVDAFAALGFHGFGRLFDFTFQVGLDVREVLFVELLALCGLAGLGRSLAGCLGRLSLGFATALGLGLFLALHGFRLDHCFGSLGLGGAGLGGLGGLGRGLHHVFRFGDGGSLGSLLRGHAHPRVDVRSLGLRIRCSRVLPVAVKWTNGQAARAGSRKTLAGIRPVDLHVGARRRSASGRREADSQKHRRKKATAPVSLP